MESPDDLLTLTRLRSMTRTGTAKAVRTAGGLSVAEVARAAGVSERSVYRWERGLTVPRGEPALRYARLLDRLMGRTS